MKSAILIIGLVAFLSSSARAQQPDATKALSESVEKYKSQYELQGPYKKRVQDNGKGDDALAGVRNFRAVLPGIVYRGGANNDYRKPKLSTKNPLPPEGLEHLCEQNFDRAF